MEVHEAFIPGIYNYCDRWCETCAFTSRCRVFADIGRSGAPMPGSLQACIEEMKGHLAPEHQPIEDRARGYSRGVAGWSQAATPPPDRNHADPRSIVLRYAAFIPPKVHRALMGCGEAPQDRHEGAFDRDGCAKVALLAIERSRDAWIQLAACGLAPFADADRFVSDLGRLAGDLNRVFPRARAFVRPGFDEPLTSTIE